MFSKEQTDALSAQLGASHVKGRNQGGRNVSYIEGWHVIAEANRIFGFDSWSRQAMELKCVSEREREIGQNKSPGWGVTYIARVRVTVQAGELSIVREGSGAGHGIDRDLGQAHESALKEAETDAMKRALMTFGNPFGLALYDKEQKEVCDDSKPKRIPLAPASKLLSEPHAGNMQRSLEEDIAGCITYEELQKFIASDSLKEAVSQLPDKHRGRVRQAILARGEVLKEKQGEAA